MEYSIVVNMLDACGFDAKIGISLLEDRALVTIRGNTIGMHNLIQKMGWHIVNEKSPEELDRRSRLWKYEDIYHTLTKKTGANLTELILKGCTNLVEIPSIEAITRLVVLNLKGLKHLKVLPTGCWLKSLKELYLSGCSKLKNVSDVLASTESLIRLKLDWTCVKELPVEHLSNLKFISLKDCKELTSLPSGICGLKLLECLDVSGCSKLSELPENLGGLERLEDIGLMDCKELTSLPSGICGLKLLESLNVSGCSKLSEFPENLGGLEGLEDICLVDCKELTSLPSGICGLKFLESLNVSGCSKLSNLPENLGELEGFESLEADFTAIKQPPSSITHLKDLRFLSFKGCKGPLFSSFFIQKEPMGFELPALSGLRLIKLDLSDCNFSKGFLPDDLGSLSSLRYLDLSGSNIISLPTSIRDLDELRFLDLRNCKKLKTLPYLPSDIRVRIFASGCTSLETLTDPAIFPRQLYGSLTNCHTLLKNKPSFLLELLRNILKNKEKSYIVVPGREIPKYFKYQNMGHYVGIQVMPDWYERLRGIFVCAVFEATAPSIDDERYAECYVMWNDVLVHFTKMDIGSVQFESDHLFLHYISSKTTFGEYDWVGEIRRTTEVNDLKNNEIIFYFRKSSPEIVAIGGQRLKLIAPVKCGIDMVYETDEEWQDHPHLSIQQSDHDEYYGPIEWMQGVVSRKRSRHDYHYKEDITEQPNPKRLRNDVVQWRDSQSELLETSIQNFRNSKVEWNHQCCIGLNPDLRQWRQAGS